MSNPYLQYEVLCLNVRVCFPCTPSLQVRCRGFLCIYTCVPLVRQWFWKEAANCNTYSDIDIPLDSEACDDEKEVLQEEEPRPEEEEGRRMRRRRKRGCCSVGPKIGYASTLEARIRLGLNWTADGVPDVTCRVTHRCHQQLARGRAHCKE
jgi:hypothetical protein